MDFEIFQHLNYKKRPETAKDFDEFFSKFAEENKPGSFAKMEEMINEQYNGSYNVQLAEWGEKLKLDKDKLLKLFSR